MSEKPTYEELKKEADEHWHAELVLQDYVEQYRWFFDLSMDGMAISDSDGFIQGDSTVFMLKVVSLLHESWVTNAKGVYQCH